MVGTATIAGGRVGATGNRNNRRNRGGKWFFIIFLILLIGAIVYFFSSTKLQYIVAAKSDTLFRVKSYSAIVPLTKQAPTLTLVLDSPRIAYDTISIDPAVLASVENLLGRPGCLYNLHAQKIIGSYYNRIAP
jgi:hypothetical protein